MDNTSILFAKIAALKKSFEKIDFDRSDRAHSRHVEHLFPRYKDLLIQIKNVLPELYADLPDLELPKGIPSEAGGFIFGKRNIQPLINHLDYILEVRANFRIGERVNDEAKKEHIFISHGRSKEWYKLQAYIERDLDFKTLELAQQPNIGRTVLQKLNEEAEKCYCAIIVMTGDDLFEDNEIRARENVLHEIGFFQGKLGLDKVILLHEEGVNIPSNIHGLVYISFPRDTVEATFGAIHRELKVILG